MKSFINQSDLFKRTRLLTVLFTMFLMPQGLWAQEDYSEDYSKYITVDTKDESVWIVDTNADNILGDGTMSYDPTNNVLTLNGIDLACTKTDASFLTCVDWSNELNSPTIHLVGSNTITLGNNASFFDGHAITFTAANDKASLTIVTQEEWNGKLFKDDYTELTPTYNDNLAYFSSSSMIKYAEPYSLWICGTQVTEANMDDILGDGKWSYVHYSGSWLVMELTLHGVSIENYSGNVISSGMDITVKVEQGSTNTISCADGYYPFYSENDAQFSFDAYFDGTITGTNQKPFSENSDYFFGTYNSYNGPTLYFTQNGYTIAPGTNQWGGVEINSNFLYDENHADVFGDGSVSVAEADNGNTINFTLNNANFRGPITTEEYENIVVDLTGVNYIRVIGEPDKRAFHRSYDGDYSVTFTGDGELRLIDEYIKSAYDPFTSHEYPSSSIYDASANFTTGGWAKEYVTPTDGSKPYLRIYKGTPTKYDLWIRDTQVTSENASNIFACQNEYGYSDGEGLASFAITTDPTTNEEVYTLTLNNTTIHDFQEMSILFKYPKLTVHLIGENHIVNGFSYYGQTPDEGTVEFTSDGGEENCLIFDSAESVEDLTNPDYYVGFSHCSYNEISDETGWTFGEYQDPEEGQTHLKLYKQDPSSGINEKYDLWIGNTQVNEKNCSNILGNGSFQYIPSLKKLFITNSTDNLNIRSEISDSLTIYLAPKSTNAVGSIVYTGNDNAKLIITTDGNYPGSVSLAAEANVISGFSDLKLEQNLIIMEPEDAAYDNNGKRLATTAAIIGVPLSPITEGKTIQPDGNEIVPEGDDSDINKVVDDILYTLGNANNDSGDGYDNDEDGGFIVINSVTTDQQATEAAQNYAPGSDEYLDRFKGLTFMVPAGSGDIEFDMQTMEGYAMKVMIGDATPVIVEQMEKGKVRIQYNVSEPTYVYAYNAGKMGEANGARGVQKGKKTTVYIKIYTVGVNPKKVKSANPAGQASGGEYEGNLSGLEGQEEESPAEKEARKGNVNGDETIDAADVAEVVNAIMGLHSGVYDRDAADVNGDGVVNAADIVMIVNKMMEQ